MTLVVPANASKIQYPILKSCAITEDKQDHIPTSVTPYQQATTSSTIIANRPSPTTIKSSGQSPIPKLDEHILSTLACRGGSQGRIRAWSIDCHDKFYFLTYQMCDNRWCERIGRQHRSNNIMWTVDLNHKMCWQSCHDLDCRGFRGVTVNLNDVLPRDALDEIDEFLCDRELEHLDMSQIVNDSVNSGQVVDEGEFDDEDMDKALCALDLPAMVGNPNAKVKMNTV